MDAMSENSDSQQIPSVNSKRQPESPANSNGSFQDQDSHQAKKTWRPESLTMQDYLSFGYLYLLSMGIITEVVYYWYFDVNILMYSGIVDILLSPLVFMTKRLAIMVAMVAGFVFVVWVDRSKRKEQARKAVANETDNAKSHPENFVLRIYALMVFCMFVGGGLGAGAAQSSRISSGDFDLTDVIEFDDGQILNVRIIGQNNEFVFYACKGETEITVAPIKGNIKRISPYAKPSDEDTDNTNNGDTDKSPPEEKLLKENKAKGDEKSKTESNSTAAKKQKRNPATRGGTVLPPD